MLGLTAAFLWGAVGSSNTQDRVDGFARLAVPGATTVSVTDPGTLVIFPESAAEVARYDLEPGRAGRAVATFQATTAGPYRVSAARASVAGATLAVGQDIARSLVLTRLGAVILALMTVLTAVPLAVVTCQARSRTLRRPAARARIRAISETKWWLRRHSHLRVRRWPPEKATPSCLPMSSMTWRATIDLASGRMTMSTAPVPRSWGNGVRWPLDTEAGSGQA